MAEGLKADDGRDRWDLLPWEPTRDIVRVLGHGARKYSEKNWLKVENARARYFAAAMRHLFAWWAGEKLDRESGLPHLAHAGCNLLFLAHFDQAPPETRLVGGPEEEILYFTGGKP